MQQPKATHFGSGSFSIRLLPMIGLTARSDGCHISWRQLSPTDMSAIWLMRLRSGDPANASEKRNACLN